MSSSSGGGPSRKGDVRVKKVSAYPIDVSLNSIPGKIVQVAANGFLVETAQPLKVNQVYNSQFTLPVAKKVIGFSGVVVKTYDRFRGQLGENQTNLKLAQINFKSLSPGGLEYIQAFLDKIGQKR